MARSCQLTFVFADSPKGGKRVGALDVSSGKAYLLHKAKDKGTAHVAARGADTRRLLEEVASERNLAKALLQVSRNKGAPGIDGRTVKEVVKASPILLPQLKRTLLKGDYHPGDIRRVWIPKPGGGRRGLGIPNVIDRWVQQAVYQRLEPIYEPLFHPSSYGFRVKRGAHTAVVKAKRYLGEGYTRVVDLDLAKFFDRVHHQRLLDRIRQRVADRRLLGLIRSMLKARVVFPDGTQEMPGEGTPQGGPLSPLLSNIVLDELDWELDRRGLRFVRYADDAKIFVRSERAAHRVMKATRHYIEHRLRLAVNEEKSAVTCPEELHFLGFRFCQNGKGRYEVHVSRKAEERIKGRIREMTPRTWGRSLSFCIEELNGYFRGWAAYFRICNGRGTDLFRILDAHVRRRLRAIILRQKRRPRFLYRHLLECGVSRQSAAGTAYSRRGAWHRSNRPGIQRAYPNAWFHERLISLQRQWRSLNPPALVSGQMLLFEL